MTTTNHVHKVRALLAKITANGCTPGEAASALSLASTIITKHGLNPADFIWPEPPAGWRWEGVRGHGGAVVQAPAEKPKRSRTTTAKDEAKPLRERKPEIPAEPKAPRKTNGERLAEMAARPEGFTIEEVIETFGILPHTVRALISIELRKKRGINIVGRKGRYTVAPAA